MGAQVGGTDFELLKVLAEYRVLTASQVAFVLDRNRAALRRRFGELAECKLVEQLPVPSSKMNGRPSNLYTVAPGGHRLLIDHGYLPSSCSFDQVCGESLRHAIGHKLLLNTIRLNFLHIERQTHALSVRFIADDSPLECHENGMETIRPEIRGTYFDSGEVWTLHPDAVIAVRENDGRKTLLFFLEVDMGTEPIARRRGAGAAITGKIRAYQSYFHSRSYKEYETILGARLNGFRTLFLANTEARLSTLCRVIHATTPSGFMWVSSSERMSTEGISGKIWVRGGNPEDGRHSIFGSHARNAPLPKGIA